MAPTSATTADLINLGSNDDDDVSLSSSCCSESISSDDEEIEEEENMNNEELEGSRRGQIRAASYYRAQSILNRVSSYQKTGGISNSSRGLRRTPAVPSSSASVSVSSSYNAEAAIPNGYNIPLSFATPPNKNKGCTSGIYEEEDILLRETEKMMEKELEQRLKSPSRVAAAVAGRTDVDAWVDYITDPNKISKNINKVIQQQKQQGINNTSYSDDDDEKDQLLRNETERMLRQAISERLQEKEQQPRTPEAATVGGSSCIDSMMGFVFDQLTISQNKYTLNAFKKRGYESVDDSVFMGNI